MKENFELIEPERKISNVQIGDTSVLGNETISMSLISSDTLQQKTKSDIIKPFIPKDDNVVTSAMGLSSTSMNHSASEFINPSELIAEAKFDYNDIEFPRSK